MSDAVRTQPAHAETSSAYKLGSYGFRSRLILGSGKYASFEQNLACLEASGAEMITVALRRVNCDPSQGPSLLDVISPERFTILPNTAGCFTAGDAITTTRLGREGSTRLVCVDPSSCTTRTSTSVIVRRRPSIQIV